MPDITYGVRGVTCNGCVNAIRRAVASMSGVLDLQFDMDTKRITVDYNDDMLMPEDIKKRIEDAGYEVEQT